MTTPATTPHLPDAIEHLATDTLVPYARNSRTHSPEQITALTRSMAQFGFTNPVLIDGHNTIIAGHGRVMAAQALGLPAVPCIRLTHLSDAQRRAYVIADNKLAEQAGWDMATLAREVEDLTAEGFDIDLLGFGDDELAALLDEHGNDAGQGGGLTDPDEVPAAPVVPVTVLGDVWLLGKHRAMCGDSTSVSDVALLMVNNMADVLFTDQPYGIDFKPQRGTHDKILNDSLNEGEFNKFLDCVFGCAIAVMKPNTFAFVWTGWSRVGVFERSLKKVFKIQAMHVWLKNNFGIGYYSRPKHEPFYLCLNGKPAYPAVAPADVWEFARVHKTIHSCEKPVGLIENILNTYFEHGTVLDLFGGSGSTLIACEKTGRIAHLMELDPKYVDVIITRWQDFTGQQATLEATGQTFAQVKHQRQAVTA